MLKIKYAQCTRRGYCFQELYPQTTSFRAIAQEPLFFFTYNLWDNTVILGFGTCRIVQSKKSQLKICFRDLNFSRKCLFTRFFGQPNQQPKILNSQPYCLKITAQGSLIQAYFQWYRRHYNISGLCHYSDVNNA